MQSKYNIVSAYVNVHVQECSWLCILSILCSLYYGTQNWDTYLNGSVIRIIVICHIEIVCVCVCVCMCTRACVHSCVCVQMCISSLVLQRIDYLHIIQHQSEDAMNECVNWEDYTKLITIMTLIE